MRTDRFAGLPLIASGVSLVIGGAVCKDRALFDELANRSLPYLFGMLGVAVLIVGAHCAVFGCRVRELPVLPNLLTFLVIAVAANVNVIWDGVAFNYERSLVLLSLADSAELTLYYALFLFVPRWLPRSRIAADNRTPRNTPPQPTSGGVPGPTSAAHSGPAARG